MKHLFTTWLCVLIILLPGCGALSGLLTGDLQVDIKDLKSEIDEHKDRLDAADVNQDGKLNWGEGLLYLTGLGGLFYARNRFSDNRKTKAERRLDFVELKIKNTPPVT